MVCVRCNSGLASFLTVGEASGADYEPSELPNGLKQLAGTPCPPKDPRPNFFPGSSRFRIGLKLGETVIELGP